MRKVDGTLLAIGLVLLTIGLLAACGDTSAPIEDTPALATANQPSYWGSACTLSYRPETLGLVRHDVPHNTSIIGFGYFESFSGTEFQYANLRYVEWYCEGQVDGQWTPVAICKQYQERPSYWSDWIEYLYKDGEFYCNGVVFLD